MSVALSPLLFAALLVAPPTVDDPAKSPARDPAAELDRFWAEAARTVRDGDYAGYAGLYHPDAVFVADDEDGGVATPIAEQLATWKPGFEDTKAGRTVAAVEFRLTKRVIGPRAAHETGLFRYVSHAPGAAGTPVVVRFEALLVRGPNGWRWVMERQVATATEQDWRAADG